VTAAIWGGLYHRASVSHVTCQRSLMAVPARSGMTRGEGEELINCMANAGVLLRFHNAVYLRPSVCIDTPMS
jgi:hypothetical protein